MSIILPLVVSSCFSQINKETKDYSVGANQFGIVSTDSNKIRILDSGEYSFTEKVFNVEKVDSVKLSNLETSDVKAVLQFCNVVLSYSITRADLENIASQQNWSRYIANYKKTVLIPEIRTTLRDLIFELDSNAENFESVLIEKLRTHMLTIVRVENLTLECLPES